MLVFKRDTEEEWHCLNCGYILTAKEAPEICPCCKHSKAYFEILCDNF